MQQPVDRHLFVIFGATGNLSFLKLLPALYHLLTQKELKDRCQVLGLGTKELGDKDFQERAKEALKNAGISSKDMNTWCDTCLHYHSLGKSSDDYSGLAERIRFLEKNTIYPVTGFFIWLSPLEFFRKRSRE